MTKTAKHSYTISWRRDLSLWLIYRDHENIACATSESEAKDLLRYYREGGA